MNLMYFPFNPYALIKQAISVLHPGVIGLIIEEHSESAGHVASQLVNELKYVEKHKINQLGLMFSVQMQDVVGDYDTPDTIPEWDWIEKNASFKHVKNGSDGVWEFVLNLGRFGPEFFNPEEMTEIPEKLHQVIFASVAQGYSYIIFHQGT